MKQPPVYHSAALACALLLCVASCDVAAAGDDVSYRDHVLPLLRDQCLLCHGSDGPKAGLDLSSYAGVLAGGSGGEIVVAGDAEGSRLYQVVAHQTEPFMPPKRQRLADDALSLLRSWIDGGLLESEGGARQEVAQSSLSFTTGGVADDDPAPMPNRLPKEPIIETERGVVTALAASPTSPLVALGAPRQIVLYDTDTLLLAGILPFPDGDVMNLKFAGGGRYLIAAGGHAGRSGRAALYEVASGRRLVEVGDELDQVLAADVSKDLQQVALGGPSKKVRRYSTHDGAMLQQIDKHTDWVTAVRFSPDGVLLATGDRGGNLFVWEAFSGQEYLTLETHTGAITALSWRADSNVLATACEDGSVRLFDMNDGARLKSFRPHAPGALSVDLARDARILTAGRDRRARIHDQNGKEQRALPELSDIATEAVFTHDATRVVTADWRGDVRVWSATDGGLVGRLSANPPTIDARIEVARRELDEISPAAIAARRSFEQADDAAARSRAALDEAISQRADLDASMREAAAAVADTDFALEQNAADQVAAARDVDASREAVTRRRRDAGAAIARQSAADSALNRLRADADRKRTLLVALRAATQAVEAEADDESLTELLVKTREAELAARKALAEAEAAAADGRELLEDATREAAAASVALDQAIRSDADATVRSRDLARARDRLVTAGEEAQRKLADIATAAAPVIEREVLRRAESQRRERALAEAKEAWTRHERALDDAQRSLARWESEALNLTSIATRDELTALGRRLAEATAAAQRDARQVAAARDALVDARWQLDLLPETLALRRQSLEIDRDHLLRLEHEERRCEADAESRRGFHEVQSRALAAVIDREAAEADNAHLENAAAHARALMESLAADAEVANQRLADAAGRMTAQRDRVDQEHAAIAALAATLPARRDELTTLADRIDRAIDAWQQRNQAEQLLAVQVADVEARLKRIEQDYASLAQRAAVDAATADDGLAASGGD